MNQKKSGKKTGIPRLLELAGRRKRQLAIACVLSVLSSAARLVPFFTIYGLLREIIFHYNDLSAISMTTVYWLVGGTALSAVAYGVFGFWSTALSHRAAYNILFEIRVQLMEKLSRLPSGYFTKTTQGGLKKIIQDDVEKIEEFIAHHLSDTVAGISMPIFTIIFLFIMDWRLGLATLAPLIIAICVISFGLSNQKGAKTQVDMHQTREIMNGTIVEYVCGMQVIKVFNRTVSAFARFGESINAYAEAVKNATLFFAPGMGIYYTALGAQLLLILPAGLVIGMTATSYLEFLPLLLLFFLVGTGLREPLENMMSMALSTNNIAVGVSRIDDILSQQEIEAPKNPKTPEAYDITYENVSFSYNDDKQYALKNVSFHIKANTITGLVGPSGGGKSTIAQLLLRFYEPQQGTIKIGSVDIRDIEPNKLMELVGYVFQDSVLFHDTIANNIRMGNRSATLEQVEEAAKAACIHDVITALPHGYDTVVGEDDSYLSGGEKQRIAIARVFLKNPPIIILDEATAYADAENESLIQDSFSRLAAGKTVLIIAHRLKSIEAADHILVMQDGELVSQGKHKQLLINSSVYQDMVNANDRRDKWSLQKYVKKGAARE